jgi:hypothetical protein
MPELVERDQQPEGRQSSTRPIHEVSHAGLTVAGRGGGVMLGEAVVQAASMAFRVSWRARWSADNRTSSVSAASSAVLKER